MAKLTAKREAFVLALVAGKTQRQAYKDAGYKVDKMSGDAIDVAACRLLKNAKVLQRFNELNNVVRKEAENHAVMSAVEVLEELSKVGRAKLTDYMEYRTAETVVELGGEKVKDYAMIVTAKDSAEVDGAPIQEVKLSKDGTFSFKLYSKLDALEKLGRHHNLFEKSSSGPNDDNPDNLIQAIEQGVDTIFAEDKE